MKVKITERGAHGPDEFEFKVGKVYDLVEIYTKLHGYTEKDGDKVLDADDNIKIPSYLVGKCVVIGEEPLVEASTEGKQAIVNPEKKEPEKKEPEKTGDSDKTVEPDEISQMSDEELSEKYKTAMGKAHHPQMKRENIEAAVREALKSA
ncbi:MAG: hypothetical protein AAFU81_01595 [Pseudomonadota bacterium]